MFSFWRKPFFSRLRTLIEVFPNIQTKLFYQFCQYGIQRIQRNDWMKFLSYQKLELFYHFWTWNERSTEFLPENFVTFVEIVLACPGYVFRLIFFLKNLQKFYVLFVSWFIQLHFWLKFIRKGFQNCTLRAGGSFRGRTLIVRICFSIHQPIPELWRQIFGRTVKIELFRKRNKKREICFEKMFKFLTISGL